MSQLPARFTIERTDAPASRNRFMGQDNSGKLGFLPSFVHANHFADQGMADSFIRHRVPGLTNGRVVRHTIH